MAANATTLSREACERRVYRLAVLLTGDKRAATRVITAVVDAQPDLRKLDSAHMDRLTVLRSREVKVKGPAESELPARLAGVLAELSTQQREAWVFDRVYKLSDREMSRAMDCSTTATQRHLVQADALIKERLGDDAEEAAQRVLDYTLQLDVPEFYKAAQRRRRRTRFAIIFGIAGIVVVSLVAAAMIWLGGG